MYFIMHFLYHLLSSALLPADCKHQGSASNFEIIKELAVRIINKLVSSHELFFQPLFSDAASSTNCCVGETQNGFCSVLVPYTESTHEVRLLTKVLAMGNSSFVLVIFSLSKGSSILLTWADNTEQFGVCLISMAWAWFLQQGDGKTSWKSLIPPVQGTSARKIASFL